LRLNAGSAIAPRMSATSKHAQALPSGFPAGLAAGSTEMFANATPVVRRQLATRDLSEGMAMWRLALTLGWLDIKLRYRGSVLGPFWLTLSTAVMVVAMGVLYATLFKMDLHAYLPYLALSLVLWNALSSMVAEACVAFTSAESTIRSMRMPFTLYGTRTIVRNALVLGHNVVVIVGVFAFFDTWPGFSALAALPGLALWAVDGFAACMLLGAFCARFRDIPPIVGSIMQIAFFLTPVIWQPQLIGAAVEYLVLNPFYPLLSIIRDPLLGVMPGGLVYFMAIFWSALLCGAAWVMFARVRGRLAFWV
jgi:lipopolysaccharide transport system permease protein